MTVPSTPRRAGPYYGTGALVSYPFSFKTFSKQDLLVAVTEPSGLVTYLVLDSSVLVTLNADQDASPGGSLNYAVSGVAAALPSGRSLAIVSRLPYSQETDLPEGGNYRAGSVEAGLDALEIQIQQLAEQSDRALTLPPGSTASNAVPTPRPSAALGWNASGTALVNLEGIALAEVDDPIDEHACLVPASRTIGAGNNALSVGPLELAAGVTVTVPAGRRWVIL